MLKHSVIDNWYYGPFYIYRNSILQVDIDALPYIIERLKIKSLTAICINNDISEEKTTYIKFAPNGFEFKLQGIKDIYRLEKFSEFAFSNIDLYDILIKN
jgi:hypothetical protein